MEKYLFEVGQQLADVFYNQENIKPLNQNRMKTIEEAAANLADPNVDKTDNWIAGAKWMADQNQEDINKLISIIEWYDNESDVRPDVETFMWFEQFKKK